MFLMLALLLTGFSGAFAASYIIEEEPNNVLAQADDLPLGKKIHGAIEKNTDKDYYTFHISEARKVEIRLKQWGYRTCIELINVDLNKATFYKKTLTGLLGSRTETFIANKNLIPGNYALVLTSGKKGHLGRYELSVRADKAATPGIAFSAKSARISKNFEKQLIATASPNYFEAPSGITYKSSNKSVAEVDSETGVVKAKKFGTATITATSSDGKTAKCTVTVANNVFNRAKPLTGSGRKLYGSVSRMQYTSDALIIYMYLLNRTGKPYEKSGNFKLKLYSKASPTTVIAESSADWPNKKALPNNLFQTIKFVIPRETAGLLDLGGKTVYPEISFDKAGTFEQLGKP